MRFDIYGMEMPTVNVEGMSQPVRCARCRGVYDLGTVQIVDRYLDCSTWRTPCCNQLVDDRGETGWTLRADYVRLDRDGYEVRR